MKKRKKKIVKPMWQIHHLNIGLVVSWYLKTDFDNNKGDYPLWKIDGKSLLQKYDRYKNKGKDFFYKSTTIYAGWSKAVVDTYYPIKVESSKNWRSRECSQI
uniref:Mitotic apparatus protein p62-like protein n=1 Tax=Triatoma infestans TaxID=30076 RepID=A0A161N1I2_TRIIF